MIRIPESVAFYWGDALNRAAVDTLAGSSEVPPDLSLAEVERFALAGLAAHRIRVEYWTLLRALWAASWGEAVRAHLPAARLLDYEGHRAFRRDVDDACADLSVAEVWAAKAVCGVFAVPGRGRLFTRLALVEGEHEGALAFYLWDEEDSTALSDGLGLGPAWGDDGEDRRVTEPGVLAVARGADGIDSAPFAGLALAAMQALAAAL